MTRAVRPSGAPRSAGQRGLVQARGQPRSDGFEAPGQPLAAAEPGAVGQQGQFAGAPDEFGDDEQPLARVRDGGEVVEQVRQRVPGVFERRGGDRGRPCGRESFRCRRDPGSRPVGVEQQRPVGAHPQQGRVPPRDLRGHEAVPGVLGVHEQLDRPVPVPQALAVRGGRAVEQDDDVQVGPGGAAARQDTAAEERGAGVGVTLQNKGTGDFRYVHAPTLPWPPCRGRAAGQTFRRS